MQKVLGLVCLQLLVTALVAALFYLCEPVKVCTLTLLPLKQQDNAFTVRSDDLVLRASVTYWLMRDECCSACSACTAMNFPGSTACSLLFVAAPVLPSWRCVLRWLLTAHDVMQLAVNRHPWVWFLAWAVTFVCVVTLAYNERARRSYPVNWITLGIFTVGFSIPTTLPGSVYAPQCSPFTCTCSRVLRPAYRLMEAGLRVDFPEAQPWNHRR